MIYTLRNYCHDVEIPMSHVNCVLAALSSIEPQFSQNPNAAVDRKVRFILDCMSHISTAKLAPDDEGSANKAISFGVKYSTEDSSFLYDPHWSTDPSSAQYQNTCRYVVTSILKEYTKRIRPLRPD